MLVSTLVSVVSASAASAARSRWKRPTSSAATCCASAALPPLPNTISLPPPRSDVTMAAAAATIGWASPRRTRSWSAMASPRTASRRSVSCKTVPCDTRAKFLFADLRRLAGLGLHRDLHRVVLAQRIALPVLGHQQAPRVRMPLELDAEQVPHFALEPVGRRPYAAHRRNPRRVGLEPHFHPHPAAMLDRDECVDQFEPRFARPEVGGRELLE